MLSDCCLSVLSVMLVYCGQMVGWINMKLGTMRTQLSLPQRGTAPNFQHISVAAKWLDGSRCNLAGR